MKRLFCYVLMLIYSCFLISCGHAVDKDNLFEMPEEELETAGEEAGNAVLESDKEHNTENDPADDSLSYTYAYGNMQKNVPPGNFAEYGDSILFTYYNGQQIRLYEINKETLEVSPFCKDATCNHNNAKCASLGVGSNLESYEGNVYGLNQSFQIVRLQENRFEALLEGQCNSFWHADHSLYVCTRDGSLLEYPDGQLKDPVVLLDEYTRFWNTIFDSRLYGSNDVNGVGCLDLSEPDKGLQGIVSLDGPGMTDGTNIYYFDLDNYMYCSDMEGNHERQLYDTPVMFASLNFDEKYIYFRYYIGGLLGDKCNEVYRASKDDLDHPELFAEIPGYGCAVYVIPHYDKLIIEGSENFADPKTKSQELFSILAEKSSEFMRVCVFSVPY